MTLLQPREKSAYARRPGPDGSKPYPVCDPRPTCATRFMAETLGFLRSAERDCRDVGGSAAAAVWAAVVRRGAVTTSGSANRSSAAAGCVARGASSGVGSLVRAARAEQQAGGRGQLRSEEAQSGFAGRRSTAVTGGDAARSSSSEVWAGAGLARRWSDDQLRSPVVGTQRRRGRGVRWLGETGCAGEEECGGLAKISNQEQRRRSGGSGSGVLIGGRRLGAVGRSDCSSDDTQMRGATGSRFGTVDLGKRRGRQIWAEAAARRSGGRQRQAVGMACGGQRLGRRRVGGRR